MKEKSDSCANCLTPLKGSYCYECGQSIRGADRFFLTLVNEAFEDIFSLSSRVWKTFGNLLWRPGFLSTEYFAGRRVRYIPPIRLYFTLSIVCFVFYSVFAFFSDETSTTNVVLVQDQAEVATEAGPNEKPAEGEDAEDEEDKTSKKPPFDLSDDEEFSLPWLDAEQSAALEKRIEAQVEKAQKVYEANPEILGEYFLDIAPPLIFCLLPFFALLLKIFYVFKGMYYTQHLILAVHDHCFVFLWLILYTLIDFILLKFGGTPGWLDFIMIVWCTVYLWLSLRVVYQQGRFMTSLKFLCLSFCYFLLAIVAMAGAIVFGIMTV